MSKVGSAKFFTRCHASLMATWGLLAIPTVLAWKESIAWVVFMSWYANFVGHFAAWQSARIERNVE